MSRLIDYIGYGNEYVTEAGSRYEEDFLGELMKDGSVMLKSVGKRDITAEIQSYEMETDINVLINRVEAGDLSAFVEKAVFGDFTELPMHPAEMYNTVINAEREFNRLPVEVKEKFQNDFKVWFADLGSDNWYSKMILQKSDKNAAAAELDPDDGESTNVKKEE